MLAQRRPQRSFSALQRAENSSMRLTPATRNPTSQVSVLFSEPKIPQFDLAPLPAAYTECFSALQRAENSSILRALRSTRRNVGFSALQRAENSSIVLSRLASIPLGVCVSVLFSEPKIPQSSNSPSKPQDTRRFQCSSASRKFLNPAS